LSLFLDAANRRPVDVTPVWLMRQAGRSLPEYRKLRERWTLVDIVAQPELCAEVTLQPVRRLGVDAAVMFADIMLPLRGMGVDFELVENVGPVLAHPITSPADVERLIVPAGEEAVPQVITAVRHVVAQSPVPVIAFSGAPFTLASYLVEGGATSRPARWRGAWARRSSSRCCHSCCTCARPSATRSCSPRSAIRPIRWARPSRGVARSRCRSFP